MDLEVRSENNGKAIGEMFDIVSKVGVYRACSLTNSGVHRTVDIIFCKEG